MRMLQSLRMSGVVAMVVVTVPCFGATRSGPEGDRAAVGEGAAAETGDEKVGALERGVLWPRFEKGQRVVLKQESWKKGASAVVRVDAEVLEAQGGEIVIRWRVGAPEVPGASEADRKMLEGMKSAALEVMIREGEGVTGIRNWEAARDETLALTERLMRGPLSKTKDGAARSPETLEKALGLLRTMMSTREGAEAMLLKQVQPYFSGAYHELEPGEESEEEVEIPMPIMGETEPLPGSRVMRCEQDPGSPGLVTLSVETNLDRQAAKAFVEGFVERLAESMQAKEMPQEDLGEMEMGMTLQWTLDVVSGWPWKVKYRATTRTGETKQSEGYTWTLVEGPAVEEKVTEE